MATCEGQCRACEYSRGALRREVSSGLAGARHRPRAQRQIISAKPEPRAEGNHTSRARALYNTPLSRLRGRVALPKGGRMQLFRYENDSARKFVWQVARVALVEQQRRERAAKCQPEVVGRSPAAAKARCGKAWPECTLSLELFLSPASESYRLRKHTPAKWRPKLRPAARPSAQSCSWATTTTPRVLPAKRSLSRSTRSLHAASNTTRSVRRSSAVCSLSRGQY